MADINQGNVETKPDAPYTIQLAGKKSAPKFGALELTYRVSYDTEKLMKGNSLLETMDNLQRALEDMLSDIIKTATKDYNKNDKMKMSISQPESFKQVFIPVQNVSHFTPENILDHVEDADLELRVEDGLVIDVGLLKIPNLS